MVSRGRAFTSVTLVAALLSALLSPSIGIGAEAPAFGPKEQKAAEALRSRVEPQGFSTAAIAPLGVDDDIPGIPGVSPQGGTLDAVTDKDDVYSVALTLGQRLSVSLTGAAGTNFDVVLYGPTATSVLTDPWIAGSATDSYPETFVYDSPATGTFYLDVAAISGAGAYTLTWTITSTPAGADDNIPGVAAPASPIMGSVNASSDPDDVYSIIAAPGQRITASLTASAGVEADLYLFGPTATTIYANLPVKGSATTHPEEYFRFDVPAGAGGTYYLDVYARGGSGNYTLTYSVAASPGPATNIPGVVLPASPASATIDYKGAENKVYRVSLAVGDRLTLSMNGPGGSDFDMYVYSPTAGSVATSTPVCWSNNATYPESLIHDVGVGEAGTYFIEVSAFYGSGPFSLTWSVGKPPVPPVARVSGESRYVTAIEASRKNFADGSAPTVILATGKSYADALSACGLAGAYGAPLLLTTRDALPTYVLTELARLGATKVVIVGGLSAVSGAVATDLLDAGYTVQRIAGDTRYETAAKVAAEIESILGGAFTGTAFLVRGDGFADALAVAPIAYSQGFPILLTRPTGLPGETASHLVLSGITDIVVVGGEKAVSTLVVADVFSILKTVPERVFGVSRFDTARAIADYAVKFYWASPAFIGVATGARFPDALGGGAAAGSQGGVLLLTPTDSLAGPVSDFIAAHKGDIVQVQVYGGPGAVSDDVKASILAAVQ